jgi:ribulose-5-phosphate 4-epimerase/fuculose-1-phosphate aldolase
VQNGQADKTVIQKILTAYKKLTLNLVHLVNAPREQNHNQYLAKLLLKQPQKQAFLEAGQLAVERKLVHPSTGEMSIRITSGQLVVNTESSDLGRLLDQDFLVCSVSLQTQLEAAPPHLDWHKVIYHNSSASAVILGHPPYTMTLANAKVYPLRTVALEIYDKIGGVILLRPEDMSAEHLAKVIDTHHAILIPGIGTLVWDASLREAVSRVEALEYVCQLTALAYQTGLNPANVNQLWEG